MRIAVMQPYFFPYIGYWQLIHSVDRFVVFDDVNFIKRGWVNRNRIILDGKVKYINLPVKKASQNKLINEIEINIDSINDTINKIKEAYRRAEYYDEVFQFIKQLLLKADCSNVATFIKDIIISINDVLDIDTDIIVSSEIKKNLNLKGEDKIVDICKRLSADRYINPIGGIDLYSRTRFNKEGIDIFFLKSKLTPYKQFNDDFVPALSIIDVLMFCGFEGTKNILDEYELL